MRHQPSPPLASALSRSRTAFIALLTCSALSACSQQPSQSTTAGVEVRTTAPVNVGEVSPGPDAAAPIATAEARTIGGDGSEIILVGMTGADLEREKLSGELACSFAAPDGAMVLVARGNVGSKERSQGVVKILDYVERVSASGGYDGMLRGANFAGQGKTILIALTGAAPTTGEESPPRAATLTYQRADGASRTFSGTWTCGP